MGANDGHDGNWWRYRHLDMSTLVCHASFARDDESMQMLSPDCLVTGVLRPLGLKGGAVTAGSCTGGRTFL